LEKITEIDLRFGVKIVKGKIGNPYRWHLMIDDSEESEKALALMERIGVAYILAYHGRGFEGIKYPTLLYGNNPWEVRLEGFEEILKAKWKIAVFSGVEWNSKKGKELEHKVKEIEDEEKSGNLILPVVNKKKLLKKARRNENLIVFTDKNEFYKAIEALSKSCQRI
jgi:hypothetical protein